MEVLGMMRDLDQIRERDDRGENSKLVLIAVGGLAAACVLFAMGVMIGKDHDGARVVRHDDPLARLDALANQVAASAPPAVTYPSRLGAHIESAAQPTLAVAPSAIEAPSARNTNAALVQDSNVAPQGVRLANSHTEFSGANAIEPTSRVRESITPAALPVAAANRARLGVSNPAANATPVAAGNEGAFTLQVSSFRTAGAAQSLAQRLRERGHRAFVATSPPQSGVTWHRVRIGPFSDLHAAQRYRADFETRERLPTFVVRRDEAAQHE